MIRSFVRFFSLTLLCAMLASCGSDTKGLIKNQMMDTITDSAINSAKGGTSKSSNKGSFFGGGSGDAHYVEDDIIFIAKEPFKGSGYISVRTARVQTTPSTATKNEGQYMIIETGEEMWTKYAYKTRIATEAEIKIGAILIFHDNRDNGICYGPRTKEESNNDNWYMAKVTDVSDKYRGYVTTSGGWKVNLEDFRIAVK